MRANHMLASGPWYDTARARAAAAAAALLAAAAAAAAAVAAQPQRELLLEHVARDAHAARQRLRAAGASAALRWRSSFTSDASIAASALCRSCTCADVPAFSAPPRSAAPSASASASASRSSPRAVVVEVVVAALLRLLRLDVRPLARLLEPAHRERDERGAPGVVPREAAVEHEEAVVEREPRGRRRRRAARVRARVRARRGLGGLGVLEHRGDDRAQRGDRRSPTRVCSVQRFVRSVVSGEAE